MSSPKNNLLNWISNSIKVNNTVLYAAITQLENAIIFILSNDGYKFGTLSISVPTKYQGEGGLSSSMVLPLAFGKKNELISKALGERISYKTNQMVISIVNLDESNQEMMKECIKLIDSLLEKMK
ncbi:MAG: hypothetical protein ACTSPY_07045 [Candidatus Helarchaeota archaeon]